MKKFECKEAFTSALTSRRNNPYAFSLYKIKEALSLLEMMNDEIGRIAFFDKTPAVCLQHCTSDDMFDYLSSLPIHVAEIMGSSVLPAIDGLVGDGVPQAKVHQIKKDSQNRITALVDWCDEVYEKVKRNPKFVQRNIKSWGHPVTSIVLAAVDIIECILYDVDRCLEIDADDVDDNHIFFGVQLNNLIL